MMAKRLYWRIMDDTATVNVLDVTELLLNLKELYQELKVVKMPKKNGRRFDLAFFMADILSCLYMLRLEFLGYVVGVERAGEIWPEVCEDEDEMGVMDGPSGDCASY